MTSRPVLLTGATGFVGRNLLRELRLHGHPVRCASRRAGEAARVWPECEWVSLDLDRTDTLDAALEGCRAAFYLVHQMRGGAGYPERERAAAERFAERAAAHGLDRIVYLGGVQPKRRPSEHLLSRLATGEALRAGPVPTVELRASMIIGPGSESWIIVRDLASRMPVMVVPSWLRRRTQPLGIDDAVAALRYALELPIEGSPVYDLPGPETLTGRDILQRIAAARGMRPRMIPVPLVTRRLSGFWLDVVTRADAHVARQLVLGLSGDLVSEGDGFWALLPDHRRVGFDEAIRRALALEGAVGTVPARLWERAARRLAPA